MKEKTMKKISHKKKIKGKPEIFFGLLGYFLGIFAINFASKGLNEKLLLNPAQAVEFLSTQISIVTTLFQSVTLPFGFLLTLVPFIFFYVLSKEIYERPQNLEKRQSKPKKTL
ncbi:hypothetical protein J4411_03150 [Candidatus Pacearchaeota archaeon]|nr:hypothetical protein [Candidatus Pacearchaeota archaeon]